MGIWKGLTGMIANSRAINGQCVPVSELGDHTEFDGVGPQAVPRWNTGQCESETIMETLTRMCTEAQRRDNFVHYAVPYRMLRNRVQRYHWFLRLFGSVEKHCPNLDGDDDGMSIHTNYPIFGYINKDDSFMKYGLTRLANLGWIKIIRHNGEDYIAFTNTAMAAVKIAV